MQFYLYNFIGELGEILKEALSVLSCYLGTLLPGQRNVAKYVRMPAPPPWSSP
jgi:hypothetical protein